MAKQDRLAIRRAGRIMRSNKVIAHFDWVGKWLVRELPMLIGPTTSAPNLVAYMDLMKPFEFVVHAVFLSNDAT